ncbi:hypothetical protein PBAT_20545 [Paenibacillus antarcticus]|uniref:Uncharacterized protein n=2 Tax=Paenibacillus antarcticus TaxID=253703 RepID=A0A168KAP5_9BACL|nr:hypothetical protein PBAT_20545 [Paenibacillus antarcticus]
MTDESIKRYLPEEVPDHLFTQSRLSRMGLASTGEHVAFVLYPEQRQQYKLFDIDGTKKRKQQKGLSLVQKDATVEQILAERKHEIEVRKSQLGSM